MRAVTSPSYGPNAVSRRSRSAFSYFASAVLRVNIANSTAPLRHAPFASILRDWPANSSLPLSERLFNDEVARLAAAAFGKAATGKQLAQIGKHLRIAAQHDAVRR